ncbi:SET (Su(var)3-9, Enhancer-of-zeste, Trithorax) domain [Teratosphaeria destructans]|uniref:SET (Su(Var)3-9, Enhancer-of-zeste, Trithorax) domain n=1 Tax=Teratosphaeria destructans TaxID=418781 RepID=A0A9W7SRS7_9PEZI|nr:SET (Su(var)3-9, Enhancer-of-zeste, Trithorax) domain [Teratosphaeria destructans]
MPSKAKTSPTDTKKDLELPLPRNWPEHVTYLTDHTYSNAITPEQRSGLSRTRTDEMATWSRITPAQLKAFRDVVEIKFISDDKHPAKGQRGLFAAKHLEPDSFLCLYLGHVHTNAMSDSDPKSDYDLNLDGELGLSIDAGRSGNEARCCNDYRGITERPNAEFRDCFVQVPCSKRSSGWKWERRVGIFVLSAGNAGKRKKGIAAGQEVLISYGKGFWEARKRLAEFRKDEMMLQIASLALDA